MKNLNLKFFRPAIVLSLVVAAAALLLSVLQQAVHVDESEISGVLLEKCTALMGEGEFELIEAEIELPKDVRKAIKHAESGAIAFQVVVKGYNKDGLNLLIVIENGSVRDLAIVENKETPGIGTKVTTDDYLGNFIGQTGDVKIVKGSARRDNEVAAVTGATKSARGVADAVNAAIEAYALLFGEGK
jgi:electron transport complex protein RnfG